MFLIIYYETFQRFVKSSKKYVQHLNDHDHIKRHFQINVK
jgi:hypothetical protein